MLQPLPYFYTMPLLLQNDVSENTIIAIWKIEESAEWFRSQLILDEKENSLIDSIKHPLRKLHWLSSRVLLRRLINTNEFIHLESDENGKPLIHNFPVNISISHSAELSALMMSETKQVGIDIEKIDSKIERIKNKFLREDELQSITSKNATEHKYIYWCAKEAMYKWYGRKQLDFKEHLFIEPFEFVKEGKLRGEIRKNNFSVQLEINYSRIENYMMAFVSKG